MKLLLLPLLFFVLNQAQAQTPGCLPMRQNPGSSYDELPSSCLDLSRLDGALDYRNTGSTFRDYVRSGIEILPGGEFALRNVDMLLKDESYIPYDTRQVRTELSNLIDQYVTQINYGKDVSPETLYGITQSSIKYYKDLNELLKEKRFTTEEREKIQSVMMNIKFMAEGISAKLNSELHQSRKNEYLDLKEKVKQLEAELKGGLTTLDFKGLLAKINGMQIRIQDMEKELAEKESTPGTSKEELQALKKEIVQAIAAKESESQKTIQEIKNYTQFAQGMVAIYSLFNPEGAAQMSAAVSGISNIAIGATALSSLAAGASAGACMGPYGMMAMGAVQLISSMQSSGGGGMGDAFKSIFKQLNQISQQVSSLREQMDSRFTGLESSLLQVEKNILNKLARISKDIDDLKTISINSQNAIMEIDANIRQLANYTVTRDIKNTIDQKYLNSVHECIGITKADINLKKKDLTKCLDRFSLWIDETSSSLMTTRSLDGQYEFRSRFEYQINDFTAFYGQWSNDSEIEKLSNPELLRDVSDNVNILLKKNNSRWMDSNTAEHPATQKAAAETKKLEKFRAKLAKDTTFVSAQKEAIKKLLTGIHKKIEAKRQSLDDRQALNFHRNKLASFKQMIGDEIIRRRQEIQTSPLGYKVDPTNLTHDEVVANDASMIMSTLYKLQRKMEKTSLGTLDEILRDENVLFFAQNCSPAHHMNVTIPLDMKYLKSLVSEPVLKRMILNPESFNLCYHLTLEKNRKLFAYATKINIDRYLKDTISKSGDIAIDSSQVMSVRFVSGIYNGEFLTKFQLIGNFEGRTIVDETATVDEKIAWRNGRSDVFTLLALNEGFRAHHGYPNWNVGLGTSPHTVQLPAEENQLLYKNLATSGESRNLRNFVLSQNQAKILEADILTYKLRASIEMKEFVEREVKFGNLDTTEKMLNAFFYFRDSNEYQSNNLRKSALSEIWGLRSSPFLKKLYNDVLDSDPSQVGLNYVYENQLQALEGIK